MTKRALRTLLALAFIAISAVFATDAAAKTVEQSYDDPMKLQTYTLKNGLKVFLSVNKETPRVTAHIAIKAGSRNDPAETTGLAHYLEHIIFKGSKHFGTTDYAKEEPYLNEISNLYEQYRTLTDPAERKAKYREIDSVSQIAAKYFIPNEYDKMMSAIGSSFTNAYTSNDVTCFMEDVPANELERWCIANADRFQNMVIRGFHTELEAVYEEKNMSMMKDGNKRFEAIFRMLFPTHPYGTQSTIGTQEHLKNPSQVNIRNYFNRYYVPNNAAICMAGDLDPDKTIALLEKYFGTWKPNPDCSAPQFAPLKDITCPQDTTVLGQETENITLAWRLKGAASLQIDTITMVDMLLCNGKAGLIDLNLNQNMKVLGASSGYVPLKDYTAFLIAGTPNEGQSLEEVKALMLNELDKIKRGEWDEGLMKSIIANWRLEELNELDNNRSRVSHMVNSFATECPWEQYVTKTDRLEKLTKEDIIRWAKEHLGDGYICVYKRKGEDTTIVKIEKPEITPIPSNRDLCSPFLKEFTDRSVEPIQPQFVDFKKDITFGETKSGLPIMYIQNKQDDRFSLTYRYDFGSEADNRYSTAAEYCDLLGTTKESVDAIKRKFYDIACNFSIGVSGKNTTVTISGLNRYLPQAIRMAEDFMANLKPDTAVFRQYTEQVQKVRMEVRTNQANCSSALTNYGVYGKRNPMTDVESISQMQSTNPAEYTDMIKSLNGMQHQVLYWGPSTIKEFSDVITKEHKTPKQLADVPVNQPYTKCKTDKTEVLLAPYDAENIYLRMISSEMKPCNVEEMPVASMYNEYFGGSMSGVVFQELREARGLAYNAYAVYYTPSYKDDTDYYMQHIISQNDKLMDCIGVFKEITDEMPQNEASFQNAKQSLIKQISGARSTKAAPIYKYLQAKNLGIDYDLNRLMLEKIQQLTLKDLVKFEQENVKGKPMRYLILGDEKELDINSLEKIAPIKRVTLDEIFP